MCIFLSAEIARKRKRKRERVRVCVSVCLNASMTHIERERECVRACVCWWEREKTKEFAQMLKLEQFEIWRCEAGMQTQRPKNN